MTPTEIAVVGAGQAGLQLALSLRAAGHDGPLMLLGAEPHPPYQRPPLSKGYLSGAVTAASLRLRNPDLYAELGIDLVLGERVAEVHLDAGELDLASGRRKSFDQLALATGARVRRLNAPGSDLSGVLYLRDMDDADALAKALAVSRQVVVVGGGFIGLEVAAAARALGRDVTVVEALPRLVARAVAPVVSEFLAAAHGRRGTRIVLGRSVSALEGPDGAVVGVRLDDGEVLAAQLVVVGIGVSPRTELAEQMGLDVRGGVVVDAFAQTSDVRVVAAGDCTVLPHPSAPGGHIRLESVQNAQDQARVAAATLRGELGAYTAVPWFWSDQADLKLQIAGLSMGHDQVVLRGDPDEERFTALYYRSGRLIACDSINRAPDYMTVRRALASGATIPPETADDLTVPLKEMVRAASHDRGED